MATTKITKRDRYNALLALDAVRADAGMVEFINHEIDLLDRKKSSGTGERKPTAQQVANAGLKDRMVAYINGSDGKHTATDIAKAMSTDTEEISVSRASALLGQLVKAELIVKTIDKRKSYFSAKGVEG